MEGALAELQRDGRLRAAINLGNRALVQQSDGELRGVSPALARRLAGEIGAALEPVLYEGAGKVFADAGRDAWDVAFLAIDPTRAETVAFTRPYHTIEATYAVRADAPFAEIDDIDRPGQVVLVAAGSAYDLHLTKALAHARIERAGSPGESFEAFRESGADAIAGVRQSLERAFDGDAGVRVLQGAIKRIEQAMVLPRADDPRLAALDDFVARAIFDRFVSAQIG